MIAALAEFIGEFRESPAGSTRLESTPQRWSRLTTFNAFRANVVR